VAVKFSSHIIEPPDSGMLVTNLGLQRKGRAATRDEDTSCPVSPTTLRSRSPTAPVRGETRQ
jgi:hypothetical protein